jgi:pyrroline-5-carboxylate reductase
MQKKIAIIGVGNMGGVIASALVKHKLITKPNLILSNNQSTNKKAASSSIHFLN